MSFDAITIKNIVIVALVGYVVYVVALAIVPSALPAPVTKKTKASIRSLGDFASASADRVALVELPEFAFDTRIQLIRSATRTLDMTCHTVRPGVSTQELFGELLRAADRGVVVRIVIDGKAGGMTGPNVPIAYALSTHPNIDYRVYNPVGLLSPWKWNGLMHDKFLLIDDRLLLLGGRNIGDVYYNPKGHTKRITLDRDVLVFNTAFGTKISGDSVLALVQGYMNSLMDSADSKPGFRVLSAPKRAVGLAKAREMIGLAKALEQARPALYALPSLQDYHDMTIPTKGVTLLANPIYTGKKEPLVAYQLQQLALEAKESVAMQTPYATANKHLLETISSLTKRGIRVDMLTNSIASSPNYPAFSAYASQRRKFLNAGTTLYEYQGDSAYLRSSIHAKTYIIDDTLALVGSLNLDDRSFYLSTETMLVVHSPEFADMLKKAGAHWQQSSLEVGKNNRYLPSKSVERARVPLPKAILMRLASVVSRLFRFLM